MVESWLVPEFKGVFDEDGVNVFESEEDESDFDFSRLTLVYDMRYSTKMTYTAQLLNIYHHSHLKLSLSLVVPTLRSPQSE